MTLCYHYHFHPVGQGLFASGCLYQAKTQQPRFLWVYDCGSVPIVPKTTEAAIWNTRVCDLKRFTHDKPDIDLMTLSHFDEDHISGVTALLAHFEVDTLLLPYVPLWDRLEQAFSNGVDPNSDAMSFTLDPVGFLKNRGTIRRIVLVLPSEDDGAAPTAEGGPRVMPDGPWKVGGRTKRIQDDDAYAVEFGTRDEVELLPPGCTLTAGALWEFLPYNRPRTDVCPEFVAEVKRQRDALLRGPKEDRQAVLDSLKAFYERTIAKTTYSKNNISLFLYAGPVYATWDVCKLLYRHGELLPAYPRRIACYARKHRHAPGIRDQCSILYSGDGYLDTDNKFKGLAKMLGEERLRNLAVFQVCHHGARGNWHEGLAKKLKPYISVFSSDPGRGDTYHPHAEVLRDFWPYRPVQVDKIGHSSGGWLTLNPQVAAAPPTSSPDADPEPASDQENEEAQAPDYKRWEQRIIADSHSSGPGIV